MGGFDRPRGRWVVGIVVLFAVVGIGIWATGGTVLVVERADTGATVVRTPVSEGSTVGLAYMHSVEKSRVYDEYTVRGTTLVMTRMEFETYGWALPADANLTRENGTFVYDPPGEYEQVRVTPGSIANHTLTVENQTYDLVERSGGHSVIIRVTSTRLPTRLFES